MKVAFYTKKYCYEDWVEQKIGKDRDGHDKKKPYFVDCTADTPGARHREDITTNKKYDICAGYILSWIAILILLSGHYQENKPSSRFVYGKPPPNHGVQ